MGRNVCVELRGEGLRGSVHCTLLSCSSTMVEPSLSWIILISQQSLREKTLLTL